MLSISITYLLYYVPLLVAVSLVYAASRHEDMQRVLRHALQTGYWITAFMGSIFLVLLLMGWMT